MASASLRHRIRFHPSYFLLFLFAALVFMVHYAIAGQAIYGDGIDYWAYLPSLYIDHDLDFTNQFTHLYSPQNNNRFTPQHAPHILKTHPTVIGRTDNPHPPGSALIWTPAFITAHGLSVLFGLPQHGYADLYQITVGLFTLALVTLALRLNFTLAQIFVSNTRLSLLAVTATFLATPLLYYGSYDLINSHAVSFTLTSLFWVLLLVPHRLRPVPLSLLLGLVLGLVTLTRLQDALLLLPALLYYRHQSKLAATHFILLLCLFALYLVPVFITWQYLYGVPLPWRYLTTGHLYRGWLGPLFHRTNGLFFRTPIVLVSLLGFKPLFSRFKPQALYLLSYLIPTFCIVVYQGGWRDAAYGGRMFISALPLFTILIALTLKIISARFHFRLAALVVIVFALLNLLSITSFVLFEKQVNSGVKTGLEEHTLKQLEPTFKPILPWLFP